MKHTHPIILLLSAIIPSHGQDASITTGFAGTNMGKSNSLFSLLFIVMIRPLTRLFPFYYLTFIQPMVISLQSRPNQPNQLQSTALILTCRDHRLQIQPHSKFTSYLALIQDHTNHRHIPINGYTKLIYLVRGRAMSPHYLTLQLPSSSLLVPLTRFTLLLPICGLELICGIMLDHKLEASLHLMIIWRLVKGMQLHIHSWDTRLKGGGMVRDI